MMKLCCQAVTWLCCHLKYTSFLFVLGLRKFEKRWSEPSRHLHTHLNTKWCPRWFRWRDESQGEMPQISKLWICQNHINNKMHDDVTSLCRKQAAVTSDLVQPDHHITFTSCCCGTPQRSDMIWAYSWWMVQCLDVSLCRIMCIISARFCMIYMYHWQTFCTSRGQKTSFTVCAWRLNYLRCPAAASCRILSVNCWVFPWCPCLVIWEPAFGSQWHPHSPPHTR